MLNIIEKFLARLGLKYLRIDGVLFYYFWFFSCLFHALDNFLICFSHIYCLQSEHKYKLYIVTENQRVLKEVHRLTTASLLSINILATNLYFVSSSQRRYELSQVGPFVRVRILIALQKLYFPSSLRLYSRYYY